MGTLWEFILNQIIIWIEKRLTLVPAPQKKAMIVGSNYSGKNALRGCLNDCANIHDLLVGVFGFNDANILKVDDANMLPNKINIVREFNKMLSLANDGDVIFFHFSGHGSQIPTSDARETDGMNEVIMTNEGDYLDVITDDEIKQMITENLKSNARLVALFDSCHSGTVMDLKWDYKGGEFVDNANEFQIQIPGNVIMFASCKDSEVSADFYVDFENQGILSYEFIKRVRKNPNISLSDLLNTMRAEMSDQTPQLQCNSPVDVSKSIKSYLT